MKKIIYFILCCALSLVLCACNKDDPFVVFSSQNPANGLNREQTGVLFEANKRVYFAIIAPKGFKDGVIKYSLIKKDEKSEFWGYKDYRNKTVKVGSDKYHTDYFVIGEAGIYILQAFDISNLSKPIATGSFKIYAN